MARVSRTNLSNADASPTPYFWACVRDNLELLDSAPALSPGLQQVFRQYPADAKFVAHAGIGGQILAQVPGALGGFVGVLPPVLLAINLFEQYGHLLRAGRLVRRILGRARKGSQRDSQGKDNKKQESRGPANHRITKLRRRSCH